MSVSCDSRCVSLAEELLATVEGTRRSDIYELAAIIQTAFEDAADRIEERTITQPRSLING